MINTQFHSPLHLPSFAAASYQFFADGADTAALMMDKTIDALLDHDRNNTFDGISLCDLDIRKGIGASYMCRDASPSSLWRHLVYLC